MVHRLRVTTVQTGIDADAGAGLVEVTIPECIH
jgi:hypothetical protein